MKGKYTFILALFLASILDGYLLSRISFVGRAGISLFYRQYGFLKSLWKGASLVFIVWMFLFILLSWLLEKASKRTAGIVVAVSIVFGTAGLIISYSDFRNTLSHRWLGEPFRLGVYLFWLGWISIAIYSLLQKRQQLEHKT